MTDMNELKDKDLEKVGGGVNVDWDAFRTKLLDAMGQHTMEFTTEHIKLVKALQACDYVEAQIILIPLMAKDPTLLQMYYDCVINNHD